MINLKVRTSAPTFYSSASNATQCNMQINIKADFISHADHSFDAIRKLDGIQDHEISKSLSLELNR